jgi:enoyl-[acyl-carrier protein] reductase III
MIETEKMAMSNGMACDGRCEVRLLHTLQKAIGDILAEHTRSIGANAPSATPVAGTGHAAPARAPERLTNGYGGQTDSAAGTVTDFPPQAAVQASAPALSQADVATTVIDTIADITRYPREILTPEARFDDDLGIDSLKRAEIVTALLNRFGQAPPDLKALGPMPLTVGEMTDFAVAYLGNLGAPGAKSEPATNNPNTPPGPAVASEPAGPASAIPPTSVKSTLERPFEGRLALVTGSTEAVRTIMTKQINDLGAHVMMNAPHSQDGEKTLGGNGQSTHVLGSFPNADHIERVLRDIEQHFGQLDYCLCVMPQVK